MQMWQFKIDIKRITVNLNMPQFQHPEIKNQRAKEVSFDGFRNPSEVLTLLTILYIQMWPFKIGTAILAITISCNVPQIPCPLPEIQKVYFEY